MKKNNHYLNPEQCRTYKAEAQRKNVSTGEMLTYCHYTFTSTATKVKNLKDIVRRDFQAMDIHPHRIVITNLRYGDTFTLNCRKS